MRSCGSTYVVVRGVIGHRAHALAALRPLQKAAPGRVPVSLASRDATAPGAARARLRPAAGRPGDQRHRQLGRGHRDLGLRRVQVRRRPGRPRAALRGAVGTGCVARAAARRAHRPARPTSHADHRQPARHGRRDRADPGRQLHHDHPARVAARADRGHGRRVARCDPAPPHERRATARGERAARRRAGPRDHHRPDHRRGREHPMGTGRRVHRRRRDVPRGRARRDSLARPCGRCQAGVGVDVEGAARRPLARAPHRRPALDALRRGQRLPVVGAVRPARAAVRARRARRVRHRVRVAADRVRHRARRCGARTGDDRRPRRVGRATSPSR